MATSALDECVSKVDTLILEVSKGMEGADAPRMTVDPDDPWAEIWNPPSHVFKVSRARAWREPPPRPRLGWVERNASVCDLAAAGATARASDSSATARASTRACSVDT